MRRLWIWVPLFAVAACAFGPGFRWSAPLGFLSCAALALALELAVRNTWRSLPVYQRHLGIFLAVSLLGLALEIRHAPAGPSFLGWALDTLAAVLGLGVSCLPLVRRRWLATLGWVRGQARRPDSAAPLILVADPHWSAELTGLREATAANPEADWLFLGDVFDVWVGLPGMGTPLQEAFLAWVDERRAQGRWVGCWMGNREYFLDGHWRRFDLLGEGIAGGLPAEALAWEHGDLINQADGRYRLWNLLSRSGVMWLLARALPRGAARTLAATLEQAMRTTNRAYKVAFPREAFRAAAAEHPGETFLTGHFHTHEEEGNGTALPWAHEGNFMVWQGGRVKPLAPPTHP